VKHRRGFKGPRLKLGMKLHTDEVWVNVWDEFHDLHALPRFILSNKSQPCFLELAYHLRVHFISAAYIRSEQAAVKRAPASSLMLPTQRPIRPAENYRRATLVKWPHYTTTIFQEQVVK
jgi:hypothetical protein